ncbi:hypothetical protein BDP27DRAFT_1326415 [Rhodocollybia butyracea]|uniref:Uncharacterized protein n=1 Tax=Rhodocollybia butyracea TaxID=206335 RepID=A0A9P5PT58_9AGAR|nr:hypothetical protein BDP27DRAFT_1326415 [Rhodocollybia butyracea]
MRFFSTLTAGLASLAATVVSAQTLSFGTPQNSTQVIPGEEVLVSVFQGDTNSQFADVAIALGIALCNGACPGTGPDAGLVDVFYSGPFVTTSVPGSSARFQNFTVTVPSFFEAGQNAQVTAALFTLTGAVGIPVLETIAVVLEIV